MIDSRSLFEICRDDHWPKNGAQHIHSRVRVRSAVGAESLKVGPPAEAESY